MKPGPGTTMRTPRQRVQHVLDLRPEICSLDMGSMNMGPNVFVNTPPILEAMATDIREAGVTPELEVFETGHLLLAKRMIETGHIKAPGMFQICLGIAWGQPATPEAMSYMRNLLPAGCTWFAFGISLHQFPMAAQAVLLGGHVRVGLEDNLYLERGKLAPSNAALVAKAVKIIELLGSSVATPAEARQMLGLRRARAGGDQGRGVSAMRRDWRKSLFGSWQSGARAAAPAAAQDYPNRTIRFIVPFGAGGPTDVFTRALGEELRKALGQPIVMENRPGAGTHHRHHRGREAPRPTATRC